MESFITKTAGETVEPAAESGLKTANAARVGPTGLPGRETVSVLLVDDDIRNLDVVESILKPSGHELVRVTTPDAALLALIHKDFACIVLDVQMPGMSGIELARLIKTRKRSRNIPIIFLTAYLQDEKDILQGYDVGAVDYLTKPLNPKIFKSKVDVFVELFWTNRALTAANAALEERRTELADVNKQLLSQIRERQQLEALVLEISEREQQRIGQDLHDGLCQQLTGIKYRNRLLQQKLADRKLPEVADTQDIEKLMIEAIEQARSQALGLNPVRLESEGLVTALSELAASISDLFKVECVCSFPGEQSVQDHTVAIHLYRIAQEAISNAIKHGQATKIQVELLANERAFQLSIEDNGVGFNPATAGRKGMGMHIMRYRAVTLGAVLTIQAGKNGGTVIVCSLPGRGVLLKPA